MKCDHFGEVVTFKGFALNLLWPLREVVALKVSHSKESLLLYGMWSLEEVSLFCKIYFNITIQRLWPLSEVVIFGAFTFNLL